MNERNPAADVLNRYWDSLVTGHDDVSIEPDKATAELLRELHSSERSPAPRETFVSDLRQRLLVEANERQQHNSANNLAGHDVLHASSDAKPRKVHQHRAMKSRAVMLIAAATGLVALVSFAVTYLLITDDSRLNPQDSSEILSGSTPSAMPKKEASTANQEILTASFLSGSFELVASAPTPGHAWHSIVEVELGRMYQYRFRQWTTETWQRTLPNGTLQLAVETRDETGQVVARYVQDGNRWQIEQGNYQRSGTGEPDRLPMELTPYRPLSSDDLEKLKDQWPEAEISEHQVGDTRVVQFRFDTSDKEGEQLGQIFGVPMSYQVWEFEIDMQDDFVRNQSISQVDIEGTPHLQRHNELMVWEEMPATPIDDDRFAFSEAPSTPTTDSSFNVPSSDQLPLNLRLSTHDKGMPMGGERLIFIGDHNLVIEVRVIPDAFTILDGDKYQETETAFGSIQWRTDGPGNGGPVRASWRADKYNYAVSVMSTPAWTVSDLVALSEALVNAQRAP